VSDVVLGSYDYERSEDIYTLTKGERSITDPDTLKQEDAPVMEAPVQKDEKGNEVKPARTFGNILFIGLIVIALLMPILIVILLLVKKRKDEKEKK